MSPDTFGKQGARSPKQLQSSVSLPERAFQNLAQLRGSHPARSSFGDPNLSASLPPSAYARLCEGSVEGRLRYLFGVFDSRENGTLERPQLAAALGLLENYANSAATEQPKDEGLGSHDISRIDSRESADTVKDVLDNVLNGAAYISCDEFVDALRSSPQVLPWFQQLSGASPEFIEDSIRNATEQQLFELGLQRLNAVGPRSPPALFTSNSHRQLHAFQSEWSGNISSERGHALGSFEEIVLNRSKSEAAKPTQVSQSSPRRLSDDADQSRNSTGSERSQPDKCEQVPQKPRDLRTGAPQLAQDEPDVKRSFVIDYDKLKFNNIIGKGACAVVWAAEWLHMPVAVKVMNDEETSLQLNEDNSVRSSRRVGDYLSEIDCLTQIRHPNVCLYMGMCIYPKVCIVTELYLGGSVHDFLHGPNPRVFEPALALDMISNVARGMLYLHTPGLTKPVILHRDLKASNILVDRGVTHCVICDFGLSRIQDLSASGVLSSRVTSVVGTPYTMAPEVMEGMPYTRSSDVYSFGIVAWEMWTGRIPYEGLRPIQLMFKATEGERPSIDRESFPPLLAELLCLCWAHEPNARPDFDHILGCLENPVLAEQVQALQDVVDAKKSTDMKYVGDLGSQEIQSKSLMDAIYDGNIDAAMRLVSYGADIHYSDYDRRTPLHIACAEGHSDCATFLIENGADIHARDRWNQTALHEAQRFGHDSIAKMLLEAGANDDTADHANDAYTENNACENEIGLSIDSEADEIPVPNDSTVSSEGDKRVGDKHSGLRACFDVMCSVYEHDVDRVRNLLQSGHSSTSADYDCRTPLHLAAAEGYSDLVTILLEYGADIRARDRWGSTPLHEAKRAGHSEVVQILEIARSRFPAENGENE